ncbi:hypothetical protein [Nocardia sp. NPDC020380]|uniref:hypothetical protein n=1 Tax=Nocardia sp. NPDC020380 TaxID=3364309 RepID=UPI003788BDE7
MTELLVVMVAAFVVIAAATVVGPRLGIAAPLVLVAIGVGVSFLPIFGSAHIEPEWFWRACCRRCCIRRRYRCRR